MRLLVLAVLVAATSADVSEFAGYHYDRPASSYGVPQSSVTERHFNALPTAPPTSLNLPVIEHQDFNALNPLPGAVISTTPSPLIDAGIVSSTPAPILDSSLLLSSTPAPILDSSLLLSSTPAPALLGGGLSLNSNLGGFGSGFGFTTPAPALGGLGFFSSTPSPGVVVTSGSQENLGLGLGLGGFTTPAPTIFSSTIAPTVSTFAPSLGLGLGLDSAYLPPSFGLNAFSTPAPLTVLGNGPGLPPQGQQVSKHLYFYAAPEEPELPRPRINVVPATLPKKNVKIIFIKTPNPPAPAPISIAAPLPDEEKTIVYVLVKKPEDVQNVEVQTPPPTPPSRPEVFFIKYKTPQEAEQAIAQVQSSAAEGSVPIDTVTGSGLVSTVSTLPLVSTTTTAAPVLNFGLGAGFDAPDISSNLISSGGLSSSLFSTGAPLVASTGDFGLLGSTTTAAPIIPHATYGPPLFKKK
ncbi:hypothetical protein NQ315_000949 [Exocentrus adspersus]|uniref:DUF243 domain-containing protein n=1 Tax=Exocentrus adspersus TaxID=1586481 RepID=A0AAV8WEC4_9CUCU|nr:hypothetical protein NQ315_000949 [Exocentrus adspersus]